MAVAAHQPAAGSSPGRRRAVDHPDRSDPRRGRAPAPTRRGSPTARSRGVPAVVRAARRRAVRAAGARGDRLRGAGALRLSRGAARAHAGMGAARRAAVHAAFPDVRSGAGARPRRAGRCSASPPVPTPRYAEFADARTLVTLNAAPARARRSARAPRRPALLPPARRSAARSRDGRSSAARSSTGRRDWVVYHTGPIDGGPGEVRKVRARRCCDSIRRRAGVRWPPTRSSSASSGWRCYERVTYWHACSRAARRCSPPLRRVGPGRPTDAGRRPGRRSRCRPARSFTTRDAPAFYLTFRQLPSLDFRVYKVRDPFAFFAGLRDPHQFGTSERVPVPQERSWIERIAEWKRRQRRARAQLRPRAGQLRATAQARRADAIDARSSQRVHAQRQHLRAGAAAQPRSAGDLVARAAARSARSRDAPRAARRARARRLRRRSRRTTCSAPTRWSSSRTSAWSPRRRRARC